MRPFGREDYRTMARIAFNESIGTDRGDAIVGAMVVHLRHQSILLPSAAVLERIALAARARARKQAYKALTAGVDQAVREKLDALIKVLEPFGLKELVQSGMVAIGRGSRSITDRALRPVERSA